MGDISLPPAINNGRPRVLTAIQVKFLHDTVDSSSVLTGLTASASPHGPPPPVLALQEASQPLVARPRVPAPRVAFVLQHPRLVASPVPFKMSRLQLTQSQDAVRGRADHRARRQTRRRIIMVSVSRIRAHIPLSVSIVSAPRRSLSQATLLLLHYFPPYLLLTGSLVATFCVLPFPLAVRSTRKSGPTAGTRRTSHRISSPSRLVSPSRTASPLVSSVSVSPSPVRIRTDSRRRERSGLGLPSSTLPLATPITMPPVKGSDDYDHDYDGLRGRSDHETTDSKDGTTPVIAMKHGGNNGSYDDHVAMTTTLTQGDGHHLPLLLLLHS
ncbi:hypothetical protein EDB89DRAFT_2234919 [Lactarius sanguifluus]|nr:hypothetical protein EDB89DRAFT_2234919 [Lactarius sanguifluus]